jgi:hypothetical protein
MSDKRILQATRLIAWERAKAELYSMLHTFYLEEDKQFEKLADEINHFIKHIEDTGLHE